MQTKRFNLVCHGMMAFWQMDGENLAILIPDEGDVHFYGIGSVQHTGGGPPSEKNLSEMPRGLLHLRGLTRGRLDATGLRERFGIPILKKERLEIIPENVRTRIEVPMPDQVRSYSGAEANPRVTRGATPEDLFYELPELLHDVVVLSWFDHDADSFRLVDASGKEYHATVSFPQPGETLGKLALYAQPPNVLHHHPAGHGQSWNQMFRIKGGSHPDLHLSAHTLIPDGPPIKTGIGLNSLDLTALADLQLHATDRSGCGSGGATC